MRRQPTGVNVIGQHGGHGRDAKLSGRDAKLSERDSNLPRRDPKLSGKDSKFAEMVQCGLDSFH